MGILDAVMQSAVAGALRDTQDWLSRRAAAQGPSPNDPPGIASQAGTGPVGAASQAIGQAAQGFPGVAGALGALQGNPPAAPSFVQRMEQNAQASQRGEIAGHNVGAIPVLGGILTAGGRNNGLSPVNALNTLGMANDATVEAAKALTGAGMVAAGLANRAHLTTTTPTNHAALEAAITAAQSGGNPWERARAANEGAAQGHGGEVGVLNAVLNPLNFVGPIGEAGTGLRTSRTILDALGSEAGTYAPNLVQRGLGAALEGVGTAGEMLNRANAVPFLAAGRGKQVLSEIVSQFHPAPDALAAAMNAGTTALSEAQAAAQTAAARYGTRGIATPGEVPADQLIAGVGRNGGKGLGPALPAELEQASLNLPMVPGGGDYNAAAKAGGLPQVQRISRQGSPLAPQDFDVFRAAKAQQALSAPLAAPPLPAGVPPPPPVYTRALGALVGAARTAAAQSTARDQLLGAAQNVAGRDVAPRQTIGQIEAAFPKVATPPAGAITPAEELAAKESALAPNVSVPSPTGAPDFPALAGSRTDLLARLSRTDLAKLVSTAYDDQPNAIHNAFNARPDPVALAERAIERITTDPRMSAKRTALLQQRDPQLAEFVAALPDQAAATAKPASFLGGDIAAGGGGMGLVAPRLAPTLAGAAGGGLVGAGAGALHGDRGNDLARDAATGAVVGGSLGSAAPSLAATDVGRGYLAALGNAGEKFMDAQSSSAGMFPRGTKDIVPAYRVERKTNLGVPLRNLLGNAVNVAAAGGVAPTDYLATVSDMYGRLPEYFAALKTAGTDKAAQERAFLEVLPAQWQAIRRQVGDDATLGVLKGLGDDYQRIDQSAANVNFAQGAARGMLFHSLGPGALTGPVGYGVAAVRGAALPFRAQLQSDLLLPIDKGARLAVAGKALNDALVAGQDFSHAAEAAGQAAKHALGDYTGGKGTGLLDTLAPGASWNVQQARVLANIVADHPRLATAAAIAARQGLFPQPDLAEPGHTGTLQFDDKTPLIGGAARLMNGGAAGQVNVNPFYAFSPVGGEALNLGAELAHPERHPLMNPLQRAADILDAGGVSINPLLGAILHKAGYLDGAPGDPDKAAKIGAAGDEVFRAWVDAHTANGNNARLAAYLPTLASFFSPDAQGGYDPTGILAGRVHSDAVDKAMSEIAYEQNGKALGDPSNRALLEQTFDPNSPLMQQAKVRAGKQLFAQGFSAVGSPTPVSATTQSAHEAAVAHEALVAAGLSPDQIKTIEVATGEPLVSVQAQMLADFSKLNTDAARMYAASSPKERGQMMVEWFRAEHYTMAAAAPQLEQALEAQQGEKYGVVPAGTAAAQIHAYDMQRLGLRPTGGGPVPIQDLPAVPMGWDLLPALGSSRQGGLLPGGTRFPLPPGTFLPTR